VVDGVAVQDDQLQWTRKFEYPFNFGLYLNCTTKPIVNRSLAPKVKLQDRTHCQKYSLLVKHVSAMNH
jgi:hypothetical protein